jgi:DNA invertase Pin-like site-specific DNA recombinase
MTALQAAPTAPIDVNARVSRKGDEKQRSTAGQVADCKASLEDRGLPVGEVFVDQGKSAWDPRIRRAGWEALMDRLEAGASAGVIVFDLERFARQPLDGERLIKQANRGAIVLDIDQEYDLTSPSGKKAFRDALSAAAYYSDRLSMRVRRGKRLKAHAGELNISSRPFGFRPSGIEPDEFEGPVLREMFDRLLAGESERSLIADLTRRGITTANGKEWTYPALRAVLLKPLNAGLASYKGEVIGTLTDSPLIPRDDYERLVAIFAARRPGRPPGDKYLCTGTAVCGLCGRNLHGRPRAGLYPDGERHREYWCGPKPPGCMRISIDQRALDDAAGALAVTILSDPANAETIAQAQAEHAGKAAKLDEAIATAEELAEAISDRLGRGELSPRHFDVAYKPLAERLARLRAEREKLNGLHVEPVPDASERWQARWDAATLAQKRTLLRMALRGRSIIVDPAGPSAADVTSRIRLA